jgi:raffinose/stachyose/melibiose transport system substrate-binding protein
MKKTSWLGIMGVLLSLIIILPSCKEKSRAEEKTPLSMWFWGSDPGQQQALKDGLIDKFNAENPGYELTVEYRSSVNKDIAVALAANAGPDIVYESSPSLAMTYIEAGKYADLTPYAQKYGWRDKLIGPMYDSSMVQGKLYSIPMGLNVIGIVYNKAVLDKNGWAVPRTLKELTKIMDEAMAKGLYASVTGNKGWKPTNEDYSSLFLANFAGTADVYKCLTGQQKWNSQNIKYAVAASAEWYQKGYLCSDYVNLDWGESAKILADGGAPFYFGPLKFIQNLIQLLNDQNKNDFQFIVFPAGREGIQPVYTIGATGILGINANSQHKDTCATVLNMIMNEEFVKQMAASWPGYWGVPLKTLNTINTGDLDGLSRYFLEAVIAACGEIDRGNFGYYNSSYFPPETYDYFVNIDTVWFGEATAEELLNDVDAVFPAELEKGLVPPLPVPPGM